jgi:hypothetical protein
VQVIIKVFNIVWFITPLNVRTTIIDSSGVLCNNILANVDDVKNKRAARKFLLEAS